MDAEANDLEDAAQAGCPLHMSDQQIGHLLSLAFLETAVPLSLEHDVGGARGEQR